MRAWLAARSPREQRLAIAAAALAVVAVASASVGLVRADLARLHERVAARTRELEHVRRLAAALRDEPAVADASLLARLEAVAVPAVGRERIAGMTPVSLPAATGRRHERVVLRVAGASLDETVRLLHALAAASPPLEAARLEMHKHPDDPRRFDLSVDVHRRGAAAPTAAGGAAAATAEAPLPAVEDAR